MSFNYLRITRLYILLLVIGIFLAGRLMYLQYVIGDKLAVSALNGRILELSVEAARGDICDVNGVSLTNTGRNYSVVVFPSLIVNPRSTAEKLARICGGTASDIVLQISSKRSPFRLNTGVDALVSNQINKEKLSGVIAVSERVRYRQDCLAAHIIGYINAADNKGVSGIEEAYEDTLHGGQPVFLAALVDAGRNIIPGLGYKRLNPEIRNEISDVVLTIDSRIQKITEDEMDRHIPKGAVVVMKPATGEILAMASRPNFDANNIGPYLNQNSSPLINRAISAYQPGSVFKLLVAAAALEEEVVKPDEKFYDRGYIDVDNLRFQGWDYEQGGSGSITFRQALAYSSNPVFIEVGQRLGAQRLIRYAKKAGMGVSPGLFLSGEAEGNLPSVQHIFAGDLANLSIGQGLLEASPLQVAQLVAIIVNDGIKIDPYIVFRLVASGKTEKVHQILKGVRVFSRSTASELKKMMIETTMHGTGREAYVENGGSAGKTGTAETGRHGSDGKGINHAWFAGYAPLDNPKVVVVVFVEDGMSGGNVAAPIFRNLVSRILAIEP